MRLEALAKLVPFASLGEIETIIVDAIRHGARTASFRSLLSIEQDSHSSWVHSNCSCRLCSRTTFAVRQDPAAASVCASMPLPLHDVV